MRRATGESFNISKVLSGDMSIRDLANDVHERIEAGYVIKGAARSEEVPLFTMHPISQTSVALGTGPAWPNKISNPLIFVMSSPRSGSTLFQLILNTHPDCYAPQELFLLMVNTVGEWRQWFLGMVFAEPLFASIKELMGTTITDAHNFFTTLPNDMHMRDLYQLLQEMCSPKILADKTPMNCAHPRFLLQAVNGWEDPTFIFLCRHPTAAIQSIMDVGKNIGLVQGLRNYASDVEQLENAEQTWINSNRNVLDVLPHTVPGSKYMTILYEQLVADPEPTLQRVCKMLHFAWEPQMLKPYDTESATKFKEAATVLVGDPLLFTRSLIDSRQADKWKHVTLPAPLRSATIALVYRAIQTSQRPLLTRILLDISLTGT